VPYRLATPQNGRGQRLPCDVGPRTRSRWSRGNAGSGLHATGAVARQTPTTPHGRVLPGGAQAPSPRWWRQNLERKSFARPLPAARAADAAVPKPASLAFFIRSTPGYRFPSSPCPDLTHRFALVRRSAFCERPTSSDSLIRPRASRRMYLASPRGENRSRFAAPFRFAVFRLAALAGRGTLLVFVCRTGSDTTGGTSAPY
jgi:hypothetical protein